MIIKAVECERCESIFRAEPKGDAHAGYFTVWGNITVGMGGGIVGNNLDEDQKVTKQTVYCVGCFQTLIEEASTI